MVDHLLVEVQLLFSEMKTSAKGIDFITSYEGYSSNIYDAENKSNNYHSGIST